MMAIRFFYIFVLFFDKYFCQINIFKKNVSSLIFKKKIFSKKEIFSSYFDGLIKVIKIKYNLLYILYT